MDAAQFRSIWGGYQAARVIMTAVDLDMLEPLATASKASSVARRLRLDPRATAIMLDALTGLGLLLKADDTYTLTPDAAYLLLRKSAGYQGDIIRHNESLWQNWSALDEVVRTGRPANITYDHHAFIMGMNNLSAAKAPRILKAINLRGVRSALDLGGGPGTYSLLMAQAGIATTLFDLPPTVRIARGLARKAGVKGIRFMAGDFTADPIGGAYDLIFISQILHAFSPAACRALLKKCASALAPKGRVVVQEIPVSDTLTSPGFAALFSVNMLVRTTGGRCYAPAEISGWMLEAGLGGIKVKDLKDNVLIIGKGK